MFPYMGKLSRNKGKRGEREVAKILRRHGFAEAARGAQHKGGPDSADVVGSGPFHCEVKFVERLDLYGALGQAERDAGEDKVPCVVHRRSRTPWLITLNFETLLDLLGYVSGEGPDLLM